MAFHAPVKELQPIDTSLPAHVIKGAVILDPQLTEWNRKAIISSTVQPSAFILINRQEQKMDKVLKNAANCLNLPENETYGLIAIENSKRFITDANLDQLSNGFMLTMSASPDHYVRRINEILSQGNDLKKMEWAVTKLDEFSMDSALIEAFYRFSSLDLLFSLIRDNRVNMSTALLNTCLNALSRMLELEVDSVGWQSVPRDVVRSVAGLVTGRAKREESNTLLLAMPMIEQLINSNETTRDWVLEEVPIESLIRHIEKSDERIVLSALSLMNSMIEQCPIESKKKEMTKTLEIVPFRKTVHTTILRAGRPSNAKIINELIRIQKSLISGYDRSMATDDEIEKMLNIETFEGVEDETGIVEAEVSRRQMIKESLCGKLTAKSLIRFVEMNPQDLRTIISENTMRIEGGKWKLIELCVEVGEIVGQLFGIIGEDKNELDVLISIFFTTENVFEDVFAAVLHLFHRTWREMQAKDGEMKKVANVVLEQLHHVLHRNQLCDVEQFQTALEAFSYRELQKIRKKEHVEKENDQLHREDVRKLGEKLRPKMEELVWTNCRNYMKKGIIFRRQIKDKRNAKFPFWFWKLDTSEKFLTITNCESEHFEERSGSGDVSRQVWIKDITDVTNNDEIDRKASSSKFTSSSTSSSSSSTMRGIRVQLREGEVLLASCNDESLSSIWIDGLSQLIGKNEIRRHMETMVERLLKMELRVRLLNVKMGNENEEKLKIAEIPKNWSKFIEEFA